MLGRRDPQGSLLGAIAQVGVAAVEKMGFYGKLALSGHAVFTDEDFAAAYCLDNGRPSVPPSILAKARLLQCYAGVSDAEVIERCRFDLRWKVVLDLDPSSIEAPFAKSTFQGFRARLTLHEQEGKAFERSVVLARERGLLPTGMFVALDSSPVRGRGAVKDTFNLLSDAIAAVVRSVARQKNGSVEEIAAGAGLGRHVAAGGSVKGSELVDWGNEEQVDGFLGRLLEDCERAVQLAGEARCGSEEVELLRRVIAQDVELGDSDGGTPKLKKGVAKDRMPSVSDPEMRHGRKSSGKTYSGHKAHVAVEETSGVITAVDIGAPGDSDGEKVSTLIQQTEELSGSTVDQAVGDSAYSTAEAQKRAKECQIELRTKMPGPRKGLFGPGAFKLSQDLQSATCPAGYRSAKQYTTRDGILHEWSRKDCGSCPLKGRCTTSERRQVRARPDFHDRRRREHWAQSEEGRQLLRKRVVVEHAIGRIKNLGAGTARYFGRTKTKAQWLWTAAVVNLSLIWHQPVHATG
jgi:hypothetical protein